MCTLSTSAQAFTMSPGASTSPTTVAATAAATSDGLNPMQPVPVVQQQSVSVRIRPRKRKADKA
jgi:hypothetical protein